MKIKNIISILLIMFSINIVSAVYVDDEIHDGTANSCKIAVLTDDYVIATCNNAAGQGCLKVGIRSPPGITWGNLYVYEPNTTVYYPDIARSSDNSFTIVYGDNDEGYIRAVTISGLVPTIGNQFMIISDGSYVYSEFNIEHTTNENFTVICRRSTGTGYVLTGAVKNHYDVEILTAPKVIPSSNYMSQLAMDIIDDSKIIIVYQLRVQYGPSDYHYYLRGLIYNYITDSFGSQYDYPSFTAYYMDVRVVNSTTHTIALRHHSTGAGVFLVGKNSGMSITLNHYSYFDTDVRYPVIDFLNNTNFRVLYRDGTDSSFVNGTYDSLSVNIDTPTAKCCDVTYLSSDTFSDNNSAIIFYNATDVAYTNWFDYPPPEPYIGEYTPIFNDMFSDLSVWSFLTVIFGTYQIYCGGNFFWLIIIIIPFIMTWIKQGSVIIPAMIALISGSSLFILLPVEAMAPIKILLTLGITGIFYHIIKSR